MMVRLLEIDDFKKSQYIDENVNGKYIKLAIEDAQRISLQEILGTCYLNYIYNLIKTDTLDSVTETLLDDYIQPYIAQVAYTNILPYLNVSVTNKGLAVNRGDNFDQGDLNQLHYLVKLSESKTDKLAIILERYLQEYEMDLPGYNDCLNSSYQDVTPSDSTDFLAGFIFDDDDCNDCYGSLNRSTGGGITSDGVAYSSSGTTANRPSNPVNGYTYYDTDLGYVVFWNGTDWINASGTIV